VLANVVQERIMAEPYGPEGSEERFKYSLFLVLMNRLTSCVVAIIMLVASGS
jgi:solute carrier family 35 (adenosine 3'-phospho 5'-phosphosulfate transporter), member B2